MNGVESLISDETFRSKQVDLMDAQIKLARRQERYELMKALATFFGGVAVFGGLVLAVANVLHPPTPPPQVIVIQQPQFPTLPGGG